MRILHEKMRQILRVIAELLFEQLLKHQKWAARAGRHTSPVRFSLKKLRDL
jgi:hypothetical protein